jgi:hypothetical protein
MEFLTIANTIALAVASVLLVALLRAYAELLRRTDPDSSHATDAVDASTHRPKGYLPEGRTRDDTPAFDVSGVTLEGGSLKVSPTAGRSILFAFLSSGCLTCQTFWSSLSDVTLARLPLDARLVIVTKDRDYESPHKLRSLALGTTPVVMSSKAWTDYGVELSPYFIFVDGRTGTVMSEGSGSDWPQVLSLLEDSFEDSRLVGVKRGLAETGQ